MSHTTGLSIGPSIQRDFAIIADGKYVVGEAYRRVDWDREEDAEANARLWTSAPELMKAVEATRCDVQMLLDRHCIASAHAKVIIERLDTIIRKARSQ